MMAGVTRLDVDETALALRAAPGQADAVSDADDDSPVGIEQRRPRIAQNPTFGALVGGGVGALFGSLFDDRTRAEGAVIGAAAGGILGAVGTAAMSRPMSLDHALRTALAKLGASFVSLRYYGRHEARLVFESNGGFDVATAQADASRTWTTDDLDDWLYGVLINEVVKKLQVAR